MSLTQQAQLNSLCELMSPSSSYQWAVSFNERRGNRGNTQTWRSATREITPISWILASFGEQQNCCHAYCLKDTTVRGDLNDLIGDYLNKCEARVMKLPSSHTQVSRWNSLALLTLLAWWVGCSPAGMMAAPLSLPPFSGDTVLSDQTLIEKRPQDEKGWFKLRKSASLT